MYVLNQSDTLLLMAAALFFFGMCALAMGLFILVTRTHSKEVKNLSKHTAQLVQKGIAEDVAQLVTGASALLEGVQQMVKTATGVGIFLTSLGLALMAGGFWVVLQVNWA
ncbi:MAG: hypothetical protein KIT70_07930 [Anaerolineales bacterium]|nr:MAG: hypothetical protein KIT70_07930 [Anaerolineales bacterium]